MEKYIMVFDVGTGAGRCMLFDLKGNLAASLYEEWEYVKEGDYCVFNVEKFWEILCLFSMKLLEKNKIDARQILAVSTTSQREGIVCLNKEGKEIYSGPSIDMRGEEVLEGLKDYSEEIQAVTGLPLNGMFALPRLLWFREKDFRLYQEIYKILMISDWVLYRLSGSMVSEKSVASSSQMFDISKGEWAYGLLEKLDYPLYIFPEIKRAGEFVGTISEKVSAETGICTGTPVVVGGADSQMGLIGMGVFKANEAGAIAGTTTPVMQVIEKCKPLKERRNIFQNTHVYSDKFILESNGGITGLALRWVRDVFSKDSFDDMTEEAGEIPVGSGQMRCYIGAEIAGYGLKDNQAGFLFPLPRMLNEYDRRNFFRSAIEANAFTVKANLEEIVKVSKVSPAKLSLCGGQSKSNVFNQILADVMGIPVHTYKIKEASGLGVAVMAAVALKYYDSFETAIKNMVKVDKIYEVQAENHQQYKQHYIDWRNRFP